MIKKEIKNMLFWLCIIIFVVSIILGVISSRECWDGLEMCSILCALLTGITVLIMSIFLCVEYSTVDANIAKNEELYKAITYKVESEACKDEFGLLSKEVIDEVQEWNKDVLYYQSIQNNFWLGIFYPDVFDQFETIDYTKYSTQND
jgi:hypothetical protein